MNSNPNLILAWLWILLGFVSGMALGLGFHRENWLGGYGSFRRRMYRLGHISFFGLGAVNLLFWLTLQKIPAAGPLAGLASWALIVGAIAMPVCCVVMAHFPKANMIFAVPVISLILGGVLTLILVHRGVSGPAVAKRLDCGGFSPAFETHGDVRRFDDPHPLASAAQADAVQTLRAVRGCLTVATRPGDGGFGDAFPQPCAHPPAFNPQPSTLNHS
jgi:hypothetical protein